MAKEKVKHITPPADFRRAKDIEFLKPLALWYKAGAVPNLPIRVLNALDSLTAYFEGDRL